MLYSSWNGITLNDIPGEISLSISISGCPLRCKGCHSAETRNPKFGKPLTLLDFYHLLKINKHISCVVFYGGEWKSSELLKYINICKNKSLKTALYTGLLFEKVPGKLLPELDYLKVGPYIEKLGGLDSKTTNQKILIKKGNIWM